MMRVWIYGLVLACMPNCVLSEPCTADLPTEETVTKGATTNVEITRSFQQGVEGYQGTVDTEIWALAPNIILADNPNASSDSDNDGGESQVLIRFDDIFGSGDKQIPKGARIIQASLYVSAFDPGNTVHLHRMNVPFSKTPTWNSLVDGVSADGCEAARTKDSLTFGKIAANSSLVIFDVTDTIQFWSAGHPNHGWVFINTGGNGWDFYTSEFEDISQRPKLEILYTVPTAPTRLTKVSDGGNHAAK
ncbi:DNRLRE domain-containing protein [Pirellulaceae bacterium SH449]